MTDTPPTSTALTPAADYQMTRTALHISPGLTLERWAEIGATLGAMAKSVAWWAGDWLLYGEAAYGERYAQVMDATGLSFHTLQNYASVARRVPPERRFPALDFGHHEAVAALPAPQQAAILTAAATESLSVSATRTRARQARLLPAPALPTGQYEVIYADPPWRYADGSTDPTRAIENQYPTLTVEELCALPVGDLAALNSVLVLWATVPKNAEALAVMAAWGFRYVSGWVWEKDGWGMGYYGRVNHELVLIGTKGSPGAPDPAARFDSVIRAPRGRHSEKPAEVRERINAMWPKARRLELFARGPVADGWHGWGDEAEGAA